jgi:hypothetical protein
MNNFSHVKSSGHGKRRASRKPGGSQLHIKPVGCYLEPVREEHTSRSSRVVPRTVFGVWRVTWHVKSGVKHVVHFRYTRENDARRYAKEQSSSACVELIKTSDPVILSHVGRDH